MAISLGILTQHFQTNPNGTTTEWLGMMTLCFAKGYIPSWGWRSGQKFRCPYNRIKPPRKNSILSIPCFGDGNGWHLIHETAPGCSWMKSVAKPRHNRSWPGWIASHRGNQSGIVSTIFSPDIHPTTCSRHRLGKLNWRQVSSWSFLEGL